MVEYYRAMSARFIDNFEVVLLDMGNTFMFGCDRFYEDMICTYAALDGGALSRETVLQALDSLFGGMLSLARDADHYVAFPTVRQHLNVMQETRDLPATELDLLAMTFAMHEVGKVSPFHAQVLRRLHDSHRLGVVSNVWSSSAVFMAEFKRAQIESLMDVIVFSSDHGSIKPSRRLFDQAIAKLSCDRSRIVYVGDKLHRDVLGANNAGISSVWVNASDAPKPPVGPAPDLMVSCISELLTA